MWLLNCYQTSLGKKITMAVTGLLLGFFILSHVIGNATALIGRQAYIAYATHLHQLDPVLPLLESALLILFLLHVCTGVILYFENLGARPTRYAVSKKKDVSLTARLMPYTGLITLLFLIVHLINFHFSSHATTVADMVRNRLIHPVYALFYMVGAIAVAMHILHGFWSLWQTLGVNHPKYNNFLQKGAIIVSILAGIIFFLVPAMSLLVKDFLL